MKTKRTNLRHRFTLFTALPLALFAALYGADAPQQKANILLLIADDQGYADFGFMGNRLVKTPPPEATPAAKRDRPANSRK